MTQIIFHTVGIVAFIGLVIVTATISNPEKAANWFHAFQSHLFQLQMEAWE